MADSSSREAIEAPSRKPALLLGGQRERISNLEFSYAAGARKF